MQKELMNFIEIPLNGKMQTDLKWDEACRDARLHLNQEGKILWKLDLGLFEELTFSLTNETQFNALFLALEHFRDVVWKEFEGASQGLCIYHGNPDFSLNFQWDEEQLNNWYAWLRDHSITISTEAHPQHPDLHGLARLYCRDVAAEYLELLAVNLTDSIPLYLMFDCASIKDPIQYAMLTTSERFEPFRLILQEGVIPLEEQAKVGICLPSMHLISPDYYAGLGDAIAHLTQAQTPFRMVPEYYLINQWDGLDYLIVLSSTISAQAKRKLQGFCAAGGTILTLGDPLDLPQEKPFAEYVKNTP